MINISGSQFKQCRRRTSVIGTYVQCYFIAISNLELMHLVRRGEAILPLFPDVDKKYKYPTALYSSKGNLDSKVQCCLGEDRESPHSIYDSLICGFGE